MDRGAWWAPAHGATKTSRTVSSWDNIRSIKWTTTPGLQVAIAKGTGVEGVDGTSKDLGFIFLINTQWVRGQKAGQPLLTSASRFLYISH